MQVRKQSTRTDIVFTTGRNKFGIMVKCMHQPLDVGILPKDAVIGVNRAINAGLITGAS
jgi:hypothetical protein